MTQFDKQRRFQIFLVNPAPVAERIQFSFITPRALAVMAAVTPRRDYIESLRLVDQAIDPFPFDDVRPGDLIGISIHTFNAIHGYALAREVKRRGATVVFGGPHASIFPEEALRHGDAAVTGDAEELWAGLLDDYAAGNLQQMYRGGRVPADAFTPARWDLMNLDRYLVASIQTVRGCPKQCSFCSVWVQDGRVPRLRANDAILQEVQQLYRAGFRLIMFADDNFYPYTRADIANARDDEHKRDLEAGLAQRFELLERLAAEAPKDMYFCTQITMEVADDPEYLAAMKRAHVQGALIGIETVTAEGLRETRKTFNSTGEELNRKLETIRTAGFPYIMGAFIFGISSDTPQSLDYTIRFARDCGIALAQFIPLTPLPGTVDFHQMRRGKMALKMIREDYDYWLDPEHPRILYHHPNLSEQQLLEKVESAWREFYSFAAVLQRCRHFGMLTDWRRFLAYSVVCRGLLTRYKRYGLSADSAVKGTRRKLATILGRAALRLLKRPALPQPVKAMSNTA
jgi:radical SAM superfamily enzyme YgiQ (UPF0313 family)